MATSTNNWPQLETPAENEQTNPAKQSFNQLFTI